MRFVAVSRVLNESDIVEAFIRHTASFVDHHILVDNGSVDGTVGILQNLKQEGIPLTVYQSHARSFVEARLNTFLYQMAVTEHEADWVVCLDVDEFIDDRALGMPFREAISAFGADQPVGTCTAVPLREYHVTRDDTEELLITQRITHCSPTSDNLKVIVSGSLLSQGATLLPGNHGVLVNGAPCPLITHPTLSYAHFATRSIYQWMSKSLIGWAKVLASGDNLQSTGVSYHYKIPFETLRDDPGAIWGQGSAPPLPPVPVDLRSDAIPYRGAPLRYTLKTEYPLRAVRVVTQYLQELAIQHGELLTLANELSKRVAHSESGVTRLL
jgi:Glycosyl transferase family 2